MKRILFIAVFLFAGCSIASAQHCKSCENVYGTQCGGYGCYNSPAYNLCTCTPTDCTIVGGQRCCNGYEGCGSCMRDNQGIERCQNTECCSIQIRGHVKIVPSWLTTIDFPSVIKDLKTQPHTEKIAYILADRYQRWAPSAEGCGHLTGGQKIDGVKYSLDLYVNAKFMELVLHLGNDQNQTFKLKAGGWWNFRDEFDSQVVGQGGIVKAFPRPAKPIDPNAVEKANDLK